LTVVYIRGIVYIETIVYVCYEYAFPESKQMKLKIKSSEIVSARVSGNMFYEIQKRSMAQGMSINDYVKNAIAKHMDYKEDTNGRKPV
jgi:hypothetical protein